MEGDMIHFVEVSAEERFAGLEHKATEIRKMLFGALLMAKDAWNNELLRREEGRVIMEAMEKAEESFTEGSQPDRFKRLEHILDVINQRAKSIFALMSYISEYRKHD